MDQGDSARLPAPQSWNKFGYALNNPLKMVDPNGENPVVVLVVIGVAAGLLLGPEAANAPENADTEKIQNASGMKAVVASSVAVATAAAILEKFGTGSTNIDQPAEGDSPLGNVSERDTDTKRLGEAAGSPRKDGRIHSLERQIRNFRRQIKEKKESP